MADQAAETDEVAETRYDAFEERRLQILWDPGQRDPKLWRVRLLQAKVDPAKYAALTPADLNRIPRPQRSKDWIWILATICKLAELQAAYDVEAISRTLEMSAEHGDVVNPMARSLDNSELEAAAIEGPGKPAFAAAKERRAGNAA